MARKPLVGHAAARIVAAGTSAGAHSTPGLALPGTTSAGTIGGVPDPPGAVGTLCLPTQPLQPAAQPRQPQLQSRQLARPIPPLSKHNPSADNANGGHTPGLPPPMQQAHVAATHAQVMGVTGVAGAAALHGAGRLAPRVPMKGPQAAQLPGKAAQQAGVIQAPRGSSRDMISLLSDDDSDE